MSNFLKNCYVIVEFPLSKGRKVCFYIAQYPVCWTAKTLYTSPAGRPVHSSTNSTSLGSILISHAATMREDYSVTCPPLSIARYSFILLSELGHCEKNENAQTSKR